MADRGHGQTARPISIRRFLQRGPVARRLLYEVGAIRLPGIGLDDERERGWIRRQHALRDPKRRYKLARLFRRLALCEFRNVDQQRVEHVPAMSEDVGQLRVL